MTVVQYPRGPLQTSPLSRITNRRRALSSYLEILLDLEDGPKEGRVEVRGGHGSEDHEVVVERDERRRQGINVVDLRLDREAGRRERGRDQSPTE
jgi:hypothetical protein